jgi:hypothetical protein
MIVVIGEPDSWEMDSSDFRRTDGYLDDVFDVLDAHRHPCILMGRYALRWMGVEVCQDHVSAHVFSYVP